MDDFIKCEYSLEDLEEFRDENGFIDLTKAGVEITPESREKKGTEARLKNWVDFDGTKALLRGEVVENYSVYAELIVEEIAKQLGIEAAHYDLIKIKDEKGKEVFGVLSVAIIDFDKEYLISLHDLIGDEPKSEGSLEDIDFESVTKYQFTIDKLKECLEISEYSEQDINDIILDYKKRQLFYLSVLETDKHPENISFIKEKNNNEKITLSPNYDSEFSLLLERDKEMVDFYVSYLYEVEKEANVQDPKIGVIVSKEDGGWNEMWKDTLETLIEDDEVYDYYNDVMRGKIDMEVILKRVEERIHAPLPNNVRNMSIRAYNSRNETMEKIVDGVIQPTEDRKEELNLNALLNSLINKGTQASIRTGEQMSIGKSMEKDMNIENLKDDKDILNQMFPDR